ncbi:MAG: DUF998 domain-containing protein [Treponema sp.]|nr:DUF998 domain-containing protein [Treponema sp.]
MNKIGWYALLIAMCGDLLFSWLLSFGYKGYSNLTMSISALGNPNSPVRLPFNIWMILEGLLFLISIPVFYKTYHSVSAGLTITTLIFIAIFAVGACIFTGFFSVNETKDVVTTASKIHGAGSTIGFMLFLFVPLLTGILCFKSQNNTLGVIFIICFILSLAFFTLFVMSDKPAFSNTIISYEGLWQRLNLLFMYAPLGVIAIKNLSCP